MNFINRKKKCVRVNNLKNWCQSSTAKLKCSVWFISKCCFPPFWCDIELMSSLKQEEVLGNVSSIFLTKKNTNLLV